MFHSSGKPNKANRFWPRLLCAALKKLRLGHRKEQYPNPEALSVSNMANEDANDASQEVLADAVGRELKDVIFSAMRRLKPRYRAVLTLRCYRNMRYEHIAHSLQCSEFAAKIQFYRAKRALQKQLSRHGFGRGAFLAAMVLFGKITAPSEAVAKGLVISAATTKVGVAAGFAALATSKVAILSLTAAGAISIGTVAVRTTSGPDRPTTPLIEGPTISSQITGAVPKAAPGIREYWHYYPRGTNGPIMLRLLKWDSRARQSYCQWLQNERANYFFDRNKNTIYIRNHRIWHSDGSVWQLPTDNATLRKSLAVAQPGAEPMQYVHGDGAGLLVILKQDEDTRRHSQITRNLNVLDEQYFLYDWPSRAGMIDVRDAMHKRGWTHAQTRLDLLQDIGPNQRTRSIGNRTDPLCLCNQQMELPLAENGRRQQVQTRRYRRRGANTKAALSSKDWPDPGWGCILSTPLEGTPPKTKYPSGRNLGRIKTPHRLLSTAAKQNLSTTSI